MGWSDRFFALARDLLAVADFQGRFVEVNDAWEQTLGWTRAELLSRPFLDLVHPDDIAKTIAEAAAMRERGSNRFVNRYLVKSGGWRWLEWTSEPKPDEGVIFAIARDVTDRIDAEQHAEHLARLVESSGDAILSKDLNGRITAVNQATCDLFGYSSRELIGAPASMLAPENLAQRLEFREAVGRGEIWRGELTGIRRDGSVIRILATISPVFDNQGRLTASSAMLRDVTRERVIEQELRKATERFQQAFDYAPIGMAVVSPEGRWLKVNAALCNLVRYSESELLAKTFLDITHPEDLSLDLQLVDDVLSNRSSAYQIEKRYMRSDGSVVWVLLAVSLARDQNGSPLHFIAQIEDISDRKALEKQLRSQLDLDPLTGVLNRRGFNETLAEMIGVAERRGDSSALIMVDLDGFKVVNDTNGHQAGDAVLRSVAEVLRWRLRAGDQVARLGGDEFAVILDRIPAHQVPVVADQLQRAIANIRIDGRLKIGASIGVAMIGVGGATSPMEAMALADRAMYANKRTRHDSKM